MLRTAPPPDPEKVRRLVRETQVDVRQLARLSTRPDTEPWWSRGAYRFDGPHKDEPGSFGTCYAALGLEAAFCETVLRDNEWLVDGQRLVPEAVVRRRSVVHLRRPERPTLTLADFTGVGLKALGLNNDVSAGDDYSLSQAWARAVHDSCSHLDGILYVSRQLNTALAVALFERSGVQVAGFWPLGEQEMASMCRTFGVVLLAE